ncbi:hypothetical protein UPYG_G00023130 [Umbra pygmaea]|uniref:Uncharacterized protein n=1 Tax=Umbra pygmaea TaxID=75934 RepID=A0ABD0Y591_UMBPY
MCLQSTSLRLSNAIRQKDTELLEWVWVGCYHAVAVIYTFNAKQNSPLNSDPVKLCEKKYGNSENQATDNSSHHSRPELHKNVRGQWPLDGTSATIA